MMILLREKNLQEKSQEMQMDQLFDILERKSIKSQHLQEKVDEKRQYDVNEKIWHDTQMKKIHEDWQKEKQQ